MKEASDEVNSGDRRWRCYFQAWVAWRWPMCRPSRVDRRAGRHYPPLWGGYPRLGGGRQGVDALGWERPFPGPGRVYCRHVRCRGRRDVGGQGAVLGKIPHGTLKHLLVMEGLRQLGPFVRRASASAASTYSRTHQRRLLYLPRMLLWPWARF